MEHDDDRPRRRGIDHAATSPLVQFGTLALSAVGSLIVSIVGISYSHDQARQEQLARQQDGRLQHIEEALNQGQVSGAAIVVRLNAVEQQAAQINLIQQDVTTLKVKVDLLAARGKP